MQRENSPSPAPKKRQVRSETPENAEEKARIAARVEKAKEGIKKRQKSQSWFEKYSYHIVFAIFGIVVVGALLSMLFSRSKKLHLTPVIEQDEIEAHNENDYGFTLGGNSFFEGWKLSDAKLLMNNQPSLRQQLQRCMSGADNAILEDKYDFREKHPECHSLIINQTNCSSSYALAAASAFSDRLCMNTGKNVRLSAQTFLSSHGEEEREQCTGGNVAEVIDFARKHGFVDEECLPYMGEVITPCLDNIGSCERHFAQEFCVAQTAEGVKREILKNGPVVAVIPVYRDFLVYKTGTYQVLEGTSKFQGGHAIKIIGWSKDKESDEEYWIVENSWGTDWGINGYAHISIGQKQLYIDDFTIAISPKLEKKEEDDEAVVTKGKGKEKIAEKKQQKPKEEVLDLDK